MMQSWQALRMGVPYGLQTALSWTTEGRPTSGGRPIHHPNCCCKLMLLPNGFMLL